MSDDIIDIAEFFDRILDDRKLARELLHDFSKDFQEKRKHLQQAVDSRDFEKIKEVAHSLKGAAGNISAKAMFECCMLVEYLARKENLELLADIMKDLDQQYIDLQANIAKLRRQRVI